MAEEQKSRLGNIIALITALTGLVAALAAGIPAVSKLFTREGAANQSANAAAPAHALVAAPGNATSTGATPTLPARSGSPTGGRGAAPGQDTAAAPESQPAPHTVDSPAAHDEPATEPAPGDE